LKIFSPSSAFELICRISKSGPLAEGRLAGAELGSG
jgi:hypothetical protein